jgi:hypothetical protein
MTSATSNLEATKIRKGDRPRVRRASFHQIFTAGLYVNGSQSIDILHELWKRQRLERELNDPVEDGAVRVRVRYNAQQRTLRR